jgi:PTS system nitrogen regulatory IIA component
MDIADLLEPDCVILNLRALDKAQLLNELAARAAALLGIDGQSLLEAISAREALGSTGVGQGVAVPHARIAGLERFIGLFARLKRPLAYDAVDERSVDLVFLLLTPASAGAAHLAALATVSRRLRSREVTERLRSARTEDELYSILIGTPSGPASA